MPPSTQLLTLRDFSGGLNLTETPFELSANESPDLLNVDLGPRGGFRQRRAVAPWGDTLLSSPTNVWTWSAPGSVPQIVIHDSTALRATTSGTWSAIEDSGGDELHRDSNGVNDVGVNYDGKLYLNNGTDAPLAYDGEEGAELTSSWNNTIGGGSDGNMPKGRSMAVYKGCVFVANTTENDGDHPNRIRWSHPGYAERWRDTDYIDIDPGANGDQIVALAPLQDRLVVFKEHAIYEVFGDPPEDFSVHVLTDAIGTISNRSVTVTEQGIFFFDWPTGVFNYDGRELRYQFERLKPALDDDTISYGDASAIELGWMRRRLWVAVPWGTEKAVLVLDPSLSKQGSWTRYDLPLRNFIEFDPPGNAEPLCLAAGYIADGPTELARVEVDAPADTWFPLSSIDGGKIKAHYTTAWYDLGEPALRKRWKKPEAVLLDGYDSTIQCEVYRDYDPTTTYRTIQFHTRAIGSGVWDTANWDELEWSAGTAGISSRIEKSSPLGNARAVQMKFLGPATAEKVDWAVRALTLKYVPKKVRS